MKHEIVYDENGSVLDLNTDEKILRELSSAGKLYLNLKYNIKAIYANGEKNDAHFRQKSEFTMIDGEKVYNSEPMSIYHSKIQDNLVDFFKKNKIICEKEKHIKTTGQFADFYFQYENLNYIIEVQRSNQSVNKYKERTEKFINLGYKIVWLVVPENEFALNTKGFSNSKFYNEGEYYIYLTEEDYLDISEIKKIRNDKTIYLGGYDDIEEFINFLFKKDYGEYIESDIENKIDLIKEKENKLYRINQNLNYYSDKFDEYLEEEIEYKKTLNKLKVELEPLEEQRKQLLKDLEELKNQKYILNKKQKKN